MKKFIYKIYLCSFALLLTTSIALADNTKIEIKNNKGLYIIKIPKERQSTIKPFVTKNLTTNKDIFKQTNAELVINGGYFDPNNQATSSYVTINKKVVLNPIKNKSLMENQALLPHLDTILNRTEFRIMSCENGIQYDISPHHTKAPYKCEIIHSIQAGPMIYPDLKLSREYFVTKDKNGNVTRDSISALKKCARTAIGLKNGDIYIIIANIYHKLTLPELYKICKDLNLDKAMNFDGGGSTSLNFKGTNNPDYKNFEITSDKNKQARKLKSFLLIY